MPDVSPSRLAPLHEVERRHVLRVLEAMRGNKTLAARALGIDRKTLLRKLRDRRPADRDEGPGDADADGDDPAGDAEASGSADPPGRGRHASPTRG